MDPFSILKVFWHHRWLSAALFLVMFGSATYVAAYGPRTYESSATYVVVNPKIPSERQLEKSPSLAKKNADNPYLRSSDPALLAKVMVTKLGAQSTQLALEKASLSTEYTVGLSPTSDLTISLTAQGPTPESATATRTWLVEFMLAECWSIQKVHGADDIYLFTALPVDLTAAPVEKLSSRLRSVIVVLLGGGVLSMGVLSLAAGLDRRRQLNRRGRGTGAADGSAQSPGLPSSAKPSEVNAIKGDAVALQDPEFADVKRSARAAR